MSTDAVTVEQKKRSIAYITLRWFTIDGFDSGWRKALRYFTKTPTRRPRGFLRTDMKTNEGTRA